VKERCRRRAPLRRCALPTHCRRSRRTRAPPPPRARTAGPRARCRACKRRLPAERDHIPIPASTAAAVAAATPNRALPSAGGSHPVPRASHWALPTGGHTTQPHANTPAKVWVVTPGYQLAGDLGRRPRANRAGGLRAVRMGLRPIQSLPRGHRWKWLGRRRAGPRQAAASGLTGTCHADIC
jgi:hypothetical protein